MKLDISWGYTWRGYDCKDRENVTTSVFFTKLWFLCKNDPNETLFLLIECWNDDISYPLFVLRWFLAVEVWIGGTKDYGKGIFSHVNRYTISTGCDILYVKNGLQYGNYSSSTRPRKTFCTLSSIKNLMVQLQLRYRSNDSFLAFYDSFE